MMEPNISIEERLKSQHPIDTNSDLLAITLEKLTTKRRRAGAVARVFNIAYYAFVISVGGWLISQIFDRTPPTTYERVAVMTPRVHAGDDLKVEFAYTRHRSCEVDISWAFYDGASEVRRFGPVHYDATGRIGSEPAYVAKYRVPAGSSPGPARLRIVIAWQCPGNYLHPLYPVTLALPDLTFEILPTGL